MSVVLGKVVRARRAARRRHRVPEQGAQPEPGRHRPSRACPRSSRCCSCCWWRSTSCSAGPRSAGTSTRSAATPRRPAAPASTSSGIRLVCFVISLDAGRDRRACCSPAATTRSRRPPVAPRRCCTPSGAAVIGGTSLFGGKGRMLDAVLGGLVIAVIINGMGLLNQPSSVGLHGHRRWCCWSRPASTPCRAAGRRPPAASEPHAPCRQVRIAGVRRTTSGGTTSAACCGCCTSRARPPAPT